MAAPNPATSIWRASRALIALLCKQYGETIQHCPASIDPAQLMWAFALTESIHEGEDWLYFPPRFEVAYALGGRYCVGRQAQNWIHYGHDSACSYGPWQVMFPESGDLAPSQLSDLSNCAKVFVNYMSRKLAAQPPNYPEQPIALAEIGKAYNHGNWRDNFDDSQYQGRLLLRYAVPMP